MYHGYEIKLKQLTLKPSWATPVRHTSDSVPNTKVELACVVKFCINRKSGMATCKGMLGARNTRYSDGVLSRENTFMGLIALSNVVTDDLP